MSKSRPKSSQTDSMRLEALLFASGSPQTAASIAKGFGWTEEAASKTIDELRTTLADRGLQLVSGDDGYELGVAQSVRADVIRALQQSAQPLSQSAMEVLTIVAYRQPLAKADIDELRGVSSDASLKTLLSRDLVVAQGMKGGAIQYRTTNHFLQALGLTDLTKLPAVKGDL